MIIDKKTAKTFLKKSKKFVSKVSKKEEVKTKLRTLNCGDDKINGIMDLYKAAKASHEAYVEKSKEKNPHKDKFSEKFLAAVSIVEKHSLLLGLCVKKNLVDDSVLELNESPGFYDHDVLLKAADHQYEKILTTPGALEALEQEYNVSREDIEKGKEAVRLAKEERENYRAADPESVEMEKRRHTFFIKLEAAVSELETLFYVAFKDDSYWFKKIKLPDLKKILSDFFSKFFGKMVKDSSII